MFGANGGKIGEDIRVNAQIAGDQWRPAVTGLADGGFAITWTDTSGTLGDASGSSIKTQVFGVAPTQVAAAGTPATSASSAGGGEPILVEAGMTVEIAAASSADVSFADGGGTLELDLSALFGGRIAGFGGGDVIDLGDIAFDVAETTLRYAENGAGTGGTLTLSDGTRMAALALLGQYAAGSFALASDGHGGRPCRGDAGAADAPAGVTKLATGRRTDGGPE